MQNYENIIKICFSKIGLSGSYKNSGRFQTFLQSEYMGWRIENGKLVYAMITNIGIRFKLAGVGFLFYYKSEYRICIFINFLINMNIKFSFIMKMNHILLYFFTVSLFLLFSHAIFLEDRSKKERKLLYKSWKILIIMSTHNNQHDLCNYYYKLI